MRIFFTLPELAKRWGKAENDLFQMAAAGALPLSVWVEVGSTKGYARLPAIDICAGLTRRVGQGYCAGSGDARCDRLISNDGKDILLRANTSFSLCSVVVLAEDVANLDPDLLGMAQEGSTKSTPPCLDEENEFHSKELKIAIEAWMALFEKKELGNPVEKIQERPGGSISAITSWLKKNYPGETGNAYGRIAKTINPFKTGGAPKRSE